MPMNAFEADICDALSGRGISLLPQYGASGYRLDFVAMHPEREGEFVLAIECDGASYHSAPTARDRDRLRQQQLEAVGWMFHRIWSTDWFLHREEQIEKVVTAWEEAVRIADQRRDLLQTKEADIGGLFSPTEEVVEPEPLAVTPPPKQRGPKPHVPQRDDIELYRPQEIVLLVRWVESDGLLRTDDELTSEVVPLLGFKRKGPKIVAAITSAIERVRRG